MRQGKEMSFITQAIKILEEVGSSFHLPLFIFLLLFSLLIIFYVFVWLTQSHVRSTIEFCQQRNEYLLYLAMHTSFLRGRAAIRQSKKKRVSYIYTTGMNPLRAAKALQNPHSKTEKNFLREF